MFEKHRPYASRRKKKKEKRRRGKVLAITKTVDAMGSGLVAPRVDMRRDWIALARNNCVHCMGRGAVLTRKMDVEPCRCVHREMFRACLNRYRYIRDKGCKISRVTLDSVGRGSKKSTWGRKYEEYLADFELVSRRNLDALEMEVLRLYHMGGHDFRACCRLTGLDKGNFFHHVYRIEERLGRVFHELKPYALYPVGQYFYGVAEPEEIKPLSGMPQDGGLFFPSKIAV